MKEFKIVQVHEKITIVTAESAQEAVDEFQKFGNYFSHENRLLSQKCREAKDEDMGTGIMEKESPYFDKHGKEIIEFSLVKVFHFTGPRRKKYYMYKWVVLRESGGKLWWYALHLNNEPGKGYWLKSLSGRITDRILPEYEIVQ